VLLLYPNIRDSGTMDLQLRRGMRALISYCLRLCGYGPLIDQLNETLSRLQKLDRDLSSIVTKEIDRLDSYLVYHANSLSRQIAELNRISYVHANLDALLMTGEFDLLIPTAEAALLSYVTRHGVEAIEPGVRAVLQARLRSGATAVDVGANIGVHALTMAKIVGPSGRVVCVEPLPNIASALERTLRLNGFGEWSQVICCAAADSAGEAILHRAQDSPMSSLFPIAEECTTLTVRTIVLDDHFAPGERVDLVKIDVEGAEPLVYKGMSRILRESPEIELILEWSASHFARSKQSAESFWDLIRSDGFKPLRIDDERPGRLVALQEIATVPDMANILLTRK
jgi:FkbM family methyltransferase